MSKTHSFQDIHARLTEAATAMAANILQAETAKVIASMREYAADLIGAIERPSTPRPVPASKLVRRRGRSGKRQRYSLTFKTEAVARVKGGRRIADVSRELGVGAPVLGNWVRGVGLGAPGTARKK